MMGPVELEPESVSTLEAPASLRAFGVGLAPDWEPLPGEGGGGGAGDGGGGDCEGGEGQGTSG